MTALSQPPGGRRLTVVEYARLDEDDRHRWELQEGNLVGSPSPSPYHMRASGRLLLQLEWQVPQGLLVIQDVDIDLELARPGRPGWSRRPDLVVVRQAAFDRVGREGGLLRASEVMLVIEIVSPSSYHTDHVVKRDEYADAAIPYYWVVDLDPPVSLLDCHLAGEFGYMDGGSHARIFETTMPFPVSLKLDELS